ncbi:MAG TPA: AAA family ATPase [Bryobacteraceae bacterium]|nr:AAA family ATPase [Bryobacteraceae bacterium]
MEAVILIGIQGTGKTTFYEQRFAATHARISLDLLKTRQREREFLRSCLGNSQRFVVDNTNVLAADRAVYIRPAHEAGFQVIGYFFDIPLRDALRQNAQRSGTAKIPVPAVIGTLKRLQRPDPGEGFDELYGVRRDPAGSFIVSPWSGPGGTAHV